MTKKHFLFCLISTLLTLSQIHAQTVINSIISSNQTLTASGNPYLLNSNALVDEGVKLTIEPGVKIKATGYYKLLIAGELRAIGTKDSVIVFDTATFEFLNTAKGYNFKNNTGSIFSYCYFNGANTSSIYTINLSPINLFVNNCKFYNCYYCIYGMNANKDTVRVKLEKTIFQGGKNPGYAIYPSGRYAFVEMDECLVKDMYGLFMANHMTITRSTFYNILGNSGLRISTTSPGYNGKVVIACNTFRKFKSSVLEIYGIPTSASTIINNNTFDSANVFLDITLYSHLGTNYTMFCQDNNFLKYYNNSIKLSGGNKPGKADTINFKNNYWNTTSTTNIDMGIRDFNDDITVAGVVDYSSYRTSEVTDCVMQNPDFVNSVRGFSSQPKTQFSLSPNPAGNVVKIQTGLSGAKTINIFNLAGKLLLTQEFHNDHTSLNCSQFSNGIYLVTLNNSQGSSTTEKLIIQK